MKQYTTGALLLWMSCAANAVPITITGYDIDRTYVSGTGNWYHAYSGTVTLLDGAIADYSGGSGTLNDGIVGTSTLNAQLFNYPADSSPVITLYLDGLYTVNSLLIHGGDFVSENTIPGSLSGLDVTIDSITESFTTVAQGQTDGVGYADDGVGFGGSSLDGLVTNHVVLSGFVSTWGRQNTFSIAEVELDGDLVSTPAVPAPAPSILLLLGSGLAGLVLTRKIRVL